MALVIVDLLSSDADGQSVTLPRRIRFSASVNDPDAGEGQTISHTVSLTLTGANSLVFDGGVKSVSQEKSIGRIPVPLTFDVGVSGPTTGLVSFNVSLRDENSRTLDSTLVQVAAGAQV